MLNPDVLLSPDCGQKSTPVCHSFRVTLEGQAPAQLDDALGAVRLR